MLARRLLALVFTIAAFLAGSAVLSGEKALFEKQSPYNLVLVTENDQGLRTLSFNQSGVRQSVVKPGDPDHLELDYARVMPIGLAYVPRPERVLIVGLGGGTIPGFLAKHCPETTIDVAELDPVVVEAAKGFFGFREGPRMRVTVGDGRKFIEECRQPYDLVMLDAFGADDIPYSLATVEFLRAVRRAVAPRGAVVSNIFSREWNPLYDSMVRTYQEVFDEVVVLDVRGAGNKIVVALPQASRLNGRQLALLAHKVSVDRGLPMDLAEAVEYGYHPHPVPTPGAEVLTDAGQPQFVSP